MDASAWAGLRAGCGMVAGALAAAVVVPMGAPIWLAIVAGVAVAFAREVILAGWVAVVLAKLLHFEVRARREGW